MTCRAQIRNCSAPLHATTIATTARQAPTRSGFCWPLDASSPAKQHLASLAACRANSVHGSDADSDDLDDDNCATADSPQLESHSTHDSPVRNCVACLGAELRLAAATSCARSVAVESATKSQLASKQATSNNTHKDDNNTNSNHNISSNSNESELDVHFCKALCVPTYAPKVQLCRLSSQRILLPRIATIVTSRASSSQQQARAHQCKCLLLALLVYGYCLVGCSSNPLIGSLSSSLLSVGRTTLSQALSATKSVASPDTPSHAEPADDGQRAVASGKRPDVDTSALELTLRLALAPQQAPSADRVKRWSSEQQLASGQTHKLAAGNQEVPKHEPSGTSGSSSTLERLTVAADDEYDAPSDEHSQEDEEFKLLLTAAQAPQLQHSKQEQSTSNNIAAATTTQQQQPQLE